MTNPFITKPYFSKELFCDREEETAMLLRYCKNGFNPTLSADRRMGKTGLIMRVFDEIKQQKLPIQPIYVDINSTHQLSDFVKSLTEAILTEYPQRTTFGERFFTFIRGLRPIFTFNMITGAPEVQIDYRIPGEEEQTLRNMFDFLEQQSIPFVIAIDEFQQIREYPEQNVEAILRSQIQFMKNVRFIFCGSKKHMMSDIFYNAKKPFYSSTQFMHIEAIKKETYAEFIKSLFEKHERKIDARALDFILEWTRRHTYYTQVLCNHVFASEIKEITIEDVKQACENIFSINTSVFFQYRELLTDKQWSFLVAVAKERELHKPTSNTFLRKYNLALGSAIQTKAWVYSVLNFSASSHLPIIG
jgi:AAA+ ATPase superfamily predicted ATPase